MVEHNQIRTPTISADVVNSLAISDDTLSEMGLDTETVGVDSSSAIEEQTLINERQLELSSKANSHKRDEAWKDEFEATFKRIFRIAAFLFALMMFTLVLQWILPEEYQWLTAEQLSKLEAVVIAVIVSKAVTARQNKIT